MKYQLFIDDERHPPSNSGIWIIARNFREVKTAIDNWGCPSRISFDHDLSEDEPTGFDIAKWLVDADLNAGGSLIPEDFSFTTHSMNPIGAENIKGLLDGYLQHKQQVAKLAVLVE